jgi:squalene-associated FAD-dependent desaturase
VNGDRVVVVGGGLAGITAAIELAGSGVPVTLVEARPWLGGATWSFGRRGLTIDNGQHAVLRCFTAYRDLLAALGVAADVPVQDRLDLTVFTAGGPQRVRRTALPAPLHLAGMLGSYQPLSRAARLAVVPAVAALWLSDMSRPGRAAVSVTDWLSRYGQREETRSQLWDALLVPALNASCDRADLGTAAALINAALLASRDCADLGTPAVPLRDLHAAPSARMLADLGADVRLGARVTAISCAPAGGYTVTIGPGAEPGQPAQLSFGQCEREEIRAAGVVLAVPAWTAVTLVPPELSAHAAPWHRLEPSPVVSVHVMYDSVVTDLPFAVSTDGPLRWITDKTRAAGLRTGQYLAAAVPAADDYVDAPAGQLRDEVLPTLERLFPAARAAHVEEFFVTRERRATFRPEPGSAALRPEQRTDLPAFALAGAWTRTGWPDTMEGAVRSGHLAARCVLNVLAPGQDAAIAPDLPGRIVAAGRSLLAALRADQGSGPDGADAEWVRSLADGQGSGQESIKAAPAADTGPADAAAQNRATAAPIEPRHGVAEAGSGSESAERGERVPAERGGRGAGSGSAERAGRRSSSGPTKRPADRSAAVRR